MHRAVVTTAPSGPFMPNYKLYRFLLIFLVVAQCWAISSCTEPTLTQQDVVTGMNLVLADSAFSKIKAKREAALAEGALIKAADDYVRGTLECNGKSIDVKARLKGDHTDHLKGNRWSFRIVAKEGSILNHRKISIQGVATRYYLHEWVYHQLLKEEGLLHLQYHFLPFCVNDSLCGIYAFESHFDSHLLEMAQRPPGPILKFDEEGFWDNSKFPDSQNRDEDLMMDAPIVATNKRYAKKKKNQALIEKAKAALDDFRHDRQPARAVFDLQEWARYIAVCELMACKHPIRWHNMRFYYNPTTEKIEPIGFDCTSMFPTDKALYHLDGRTELFHQKMLKDDAYKAAVISEMERLAVPQYVTSFLEPKHALIDSMQTLLQQELPKYKFWNEVLYDSQKRITSQLAEPSAHQP